MVNHRSPLDSRGAHGPRVLQFSLDVFFPNCTIKHETLKTGMGDNRGSNTKAKLGHRVSSRTAPYHSISATPLEGV